MHSMTKQQIEYAIALLEANKPQTARGEAIRQARLAALRVYLEKLNAR